jgi:uncharacterized protein (DUF433 family)
MTTLPQRITVNPKQCGGRPCIRGMRFGYLMFWSYMLLD